MGFQVGDVVADYEILAQLGAGGMGQVFKVRNRISGRVEAMKVILPELSKDPGLAARFMREIQVQASLDHPNIAGLRTALSHENQLLMIMEFVEGSTLDHLLQKGPLPLQQAVDYTCQALAGLSYAHGRGVVHRDIKPANLMLTPTGIIKVMDFGIARAREDSKLTMTGATLGSLFYMSPEQIRGASPPDPRSDLYSLGVTLYELVTGRRPFEGDSQFSIMTAHLEHAPKPPIEVDARLPQALNEIILIALAKDPSTRFQTADAFKAALGNVRQDLGPAATATAPAQKQAAAAVSPVSAVPATPPVRTAPPPEARSSHRGLYMLLGGVVVVAVLVIAGIQGPKWYKAIAGGSQATPSESAPVQTAPVAQPESAPAVTPSSAPAADTTQPVANPAPAPASQEPASAAPTGSGLSGGAKPASPRRTVERPASRAAGSATSGQSAAPPSQMAPSSPPPTEAHAPVAPPAAEQANAKALSELRERRTDVVVRAKAALSSLENVEREQRASGLAMRSDIVAARTRMTASLDDADAAFAGNDAAAAEKSLDRAEMSLRVIEKFIGH